MAPPERRLLIATTNRGKAREVIAALADLRAEFVCLKDLQAAPPEETGTTFAQNAAIKATYYAMRFGGWALADDSGLEVDVLDGAPGVHSARYAGPNATDVENNVRLVEALSRFPEENCRARFRCAMVLADPDGVRATAAGAVEGRILKSPRGSNGFGYDPHFFIPEEGLTMAELSADRKNAISHRGRALREMRRALGALLAAPR